MNIDFNGLAITKAQLGYYFVPSIIRKYFAEPDVWFDLGNGYVRHGYFVEKIREKIIAHDLSVRIADNRRIDAHIRKYLTDPEIEYLKLDRELEKKTHQKNKTIKI